MNQGLTKHPVLTLGYVRLTDAAPLIVAQELGFYGKYDLAVTLVRERSWAGLRDKLTVGVFDAAQMLAPLPLFASAGVGSPPVTMLSGLALGRNGNAITVSHALANELSVAGCPAIEEAQLSSVGHALGQVIRRRCEAQRAPLRLATVHPIAVHTIQWGMLLRAAGLGWGDVEWVILPPEQMVHALRDGTIDGFNAGSPWFAGAIAEGSGVLLLTGAAIWPDAPEKVLAVTEQWHGQHPQWHSQLRLALMDALAWLEQPGARQQAVEMLALPRYLDLPASWLRPGLLGVDMLAALPESRRFHRFGIHECSDPAACDPEHFVSGLAGLVDIDGDVAKKLIPQVYRSDLYHASLSVWHGEAAPPNNACSMHRDGANDA